LLCLCLCSQHILRIAYAIILRFKSEKFKREYVVNSFHFNVNMRYFSFCLFYFRNDTDSVFLRFHKSLMFAESNL
jgi:hypothetical protein